MSYSRLRIFFDRNDIETESTLRMRVAKDNDITVHIDGARLASLAIVVDACEIAKYAVSIKNLII